MRIGISVSMMIEGPESQFAEDRKRSESSVKQAFCMAWMLNYHKWNLLYKIMDNEGYHDKEGRLQRRAPKNDIRKVRGRERKCKDLGNPHPFPGWRPGNRKVQGPYPGAIAQRFVASRVGRTGLRQIATREQQENSEVRSHHQEIRKEGS
jgi:hypothetical protein